MRCEGKWDGISYCYSFDTIYNYPQTIDIPFDKLIPVVRAKTFPEAGVFDSSRVYGRQVNTPQVILISSAGVTRPKRPGIDLSQEPPPELEEHNPWWAIASLPTPEVFLNKIGL